MSTETSPRVRAGRQEGSGPGRAPAFTQSAPRIPRRYGQWAGSVLFVVMAVLLAGWFWQQKSDRVEVLVVAEPIPVGAVITTDDLEVADVAGVAGAISASRSGEVVGATAAVEMVRGQVLTADMVTTAAVPSPGERVVGMQLDATRSPAGLEPGDTVAVVAVPPAGDPSSPNDLDNPKVLAPAATVLTAEAIEGAGVRLSLVVPEAVAERVTAYVAAGRVALLQAPSEGAE